MQRIFFSLFAFFAKKLPLSPIANRAFLRCLSVVYSTQKKSIGSPFFWKKKKRALHEKIKKRRVLKKTQIYSPKLLNFQEVNKNLDLNVSHGLWPHPKKDFF